jgi:hypothetical protein
VMAAEFPGRRLHALITSDGLGARQANPGATAMSAAMRRLALRYLG